MTSSKAAHLSHYFLSKDPSFPSLLSQFTHRLTLVTYFSIPPGSRVLEIGCGQGDCTIVLADTVGEDGWVDGVDPGRDDYGSFSFLSYLNSGRK
jgi:cyclopropane fatty-acyl-phospholipid synthase-like methyltransferase